MAIKRLKFNGRKQKIRFLDDGEVIPSGAYFIMPKVSIDDITSDDLHGALETKCPGDVVNQHPDRTYFVVVPF